MSVEITELSADAVRDYILANGGKVYNNDLVKHFKRWLTQPQNKEAARLRFKEIINDIAIVSKDDRNEKFLVLKKAVHSSSVSPEPKVKASSSFASLDTGDSFSTASTCSLNSIASFSKQPPPYRSPPPISATKISSETKEDDSESSPPPVPPRRKSSDKIKNDNKENVSDNGSQQRGTTTPVEDNEKKDSDRKISVKERTQRFNRLASTEEAPAAASSPNSTSTAVSDKKKNEKGRTSDRDEEDSASVASFDPRSKEWLVRAAQGNYHALAKLCADNPKLARVKDPATTALHWGAKHGNMDIIKLIAGTHKVDANIRTGYTPLHLAAQFSREDAYDLLIKVYGADTSLRDWSGKKPNQYRNMGSKNSDLKADMLRKSKSHKKSSEKDSGFLRIGSLNVRVKRTTEAVSNFLGVNQSSLDKSHKSWGSADNIQDCLKMPPPKFAPVKKRKPRKEQLSQNARHSKTLSGMKIDEKSDSDSDTVFGFDSNWKRGGNH